MENRVNRPFTLAIFLVLLICLANSAKADLIWYAYGGHEYALTSTWSNWQDSESEAASTGGHLVTINDAAENSWLTATFSNTFNRSGAGQAWQAIAWIGYYYDGSASEWRWISGEPVTYFNHDYPLWPQGGDFAYLHLPPHPYAGTWNANPLHQYDYSFQPKGIIERLGQETVPEPTTMLLFGTGLAGLFGKRIRRKK